MLFDKYLALSGPQTVNVNESMKQDILSKINSHPTVIIDHDLFDDVKKELELLMSTDTLSRFKNSQQFEAHFIQSSFGVHPLSLDEM